MKKICVYSGSNPGNRPEYKELATRLGQVFLQHEIELIYGGSKLGLMGAMANHILDNGGKVTGVMPSGLFPTELVHERLTRFIEVRDMHERKKTMADLADGFITLPGGIGTYEELFETLSWAQLGIHNKPIGALNVADFFEPVLSLLQNTVQEGFMKESNMQLLLVATDPQELIDRMNKYVPPVLGTKWCELPVTPT